MKTAAETGLASHSSNMVAPRDLNRETEDGWTVVTSKKTLRRIRKDQKNNKINNKNQDKNASSEDVSMKSTPSDESSWSSIVKRSLKMNVPKMDIKFNVPYQPTQKPKNSDLKSSKVQNNKINEGTISKPPAKPSPPEIINISDDDDLSSIECLFSVKKNNNKTDLSVPKIIELEIQETSKTGQIKRTPERDFTSSKKREHESTFSATCSTSKMKKYDTNKKNRTSRNDKTTPSSTTEQQKNFQKHIDQEQAMWEINNHHKAIRDYAKFINKNDFIDKCRKNDQNMDDTDYTKIIKRDLPRLHCSQNPISRKTLIKDLQDKIFSTTPQEWGEFRRKRGEELRRLEKTIIFNQLLKNNFTHAWKEIYTDVNDYCNEYCVPNNQRIKLFRKELEYLSLYIHDVLPLNYNEQGIHPDDTSISRYTKIFSENDSLLVARKKWHDFILQDYDYFWDVYSYKINYRNLTDAEIVKLQDLYDIVYFINPEGIRTLLNTPDTHSIINYIYQRYIKVKNWVPSRHYTYYIWSIYGWKELPHHFPSYDSDHNSKNIVLSRWIPKSIPYEKFITFDHYEISPLTNNKPNTPITPKIITSKKRKS